MVYPGLQGVPSSCAPGLTLEQTGPGFGDDPRYNCEDFNGYMFVSNYPKQSP